MKRKWIKGGFAVLASVLIVGLTRSFAAPVEVGKVNWGRDLDAALQASKDSGKPVLLLFQEVPG